MPGLVAAIGQMASKGQRQFVFAMAPGLTQAELQGHMAPLEPATTVVENATYDLLGAADVAVISSGTATVEAALLGVPMVVIYRVAPFTAFVVRQLARTKLFAMVNLLAGKEIVPELIQDDFTPERLVRETERLLDSAEAREIMRGELAKVRHTLGPSGAIERAADIIAVMIQEKPAGILQ
jgi:lipid-A-disaccharide synthase